MLSIKMTPGNRKLKVDPEEGKEVRVRRDSSSGSGESSWRLVGVLASSSLGTI